MSEHKGRLESAAIMPPDHPLLQSGEPGLLTGLDQPVPVNPKDQAALDRVPLHLLPPLGPIHGAQACRDGAVKYGPYNWRDKKISLMGYIGAMQRHLAAIIDGEDAAADSGVDHLGHVIATASILLDARACGMLIDDRPSPGRAPDELHRQRKLNEERRREA